MFIKTRIFILIIILLIIGGAIFLNLIYSSVGLNPSEDVFIIKSGQGVNEISQNLKEAGLIKNKFIFEIYVYLKKIEKNFLAGEYKINKPKSIKEIVDILTLGKGVIIDREIKIIEGWSNSDIANYLVRQGVIQQEKEFIDIVDTNFQLSIFNFQTNSKFLISDYIFLQDLPEGASLEGYLFPDTYRVSKEPSIEEIVKKMLDNFDKKLTIEMREEIENPRKASPRGEQGKTIHQIITLASIIEKEVANDEDRGVVAGIFYKRLKIGMPLQSDATVNYTTGKKEIRPSFNDLETDSLYNTYKYKGLPPGPICNPGLSAILAAIYPQETDYLYFLTTKEGKTIFSKTFTEHIANRIKYLNL